MANKADTIKSLRAVLTPAEFGRLTKINAMVKKGDDLPRKDQELFDKASSFIESLGSSVIENKSPFKNPVDEARVRKNLAEIGNRPEKRLEILQREFGEGNVAGVGNVFLVKGEDGTLRPVNRGGAITDFGDFIGDAAELLPGLARTGRTALLGGGGELAAGVAGAFTGTGPVGIIAGASAGGGAGSALAEAQNIQDEIGQLVKQGLVTEEEAEALQGEVKQAAVTGGVLGTIFGAGGRFLSPIAGQAVKRITSLVSKGKALAPNISKIIQEGVAPEKTLAETGAKALERLRQSGFSQLERATLAEEVAQQRVKGLAEGADEEEFGKFVGNAIGDAFTKTKSKVDALFQRARQMSQGDIDLRNQFLMAGAEGPMPMAADITQEFTGLQKGLSRLERGQTYVSSLENALSRTLPDELVDLPTEQKVKYLTDIDIENMMEVLSDDINSLFLKKNSSGLDPAEREVLSGLQDFKRQLSIKPPVTGNKAASTLFKSARNERRLMSQEFPEEVQSFALIKERDIDIPRTEQKASKIASGIFQAAPEVQRRVRDIIAGEGKMAQLDNLGGRALLKGSIKVSRGVGKGLGTRKFDPRTGKETITPLQDVEGELGDLVPQVFAEGDDLAAIQQRQDLDVQRIKELGDPNALVPRTDKIDIIGTEKSFQGIADEGIDKGEVIKGGHNLLSKRRVKEIGNVLTEGKKAQQRLQTKQKLFGEVDKSTLKTEGAQAFDPGALFGQAIEKIGGPVAEFSIQQAQNLLGTGALIAPPVANRAVQSLLGGSQGVRPEDIRKIELQQRFR